MIRIRHSITVALMGVFILGCAGGPRVGTQAPGFVALDDEGQPISLHDYRGSVVVFYFWATWSPPCVVVGPRVQAIQEEFDGKDVVVLGVHYDAGGNPGKYMAEHKYTYELIPRGRVVVDAYGVKKIPQIVVVDPNGTVVYQQIGFEERDKERLTDVIKKNLPQNK
ncbi:MAG: TlpA family protein disulfide reductase [Candidatus Latescibacterota bacterium]|nr:MAG: TlpA family protein disulfide reductase [Candidatus Latescibacterota bacterium]